jgi:demethylmenaquinone methyltransferase/2-methoxy-6-polyprenyl-1,4-benzoquinol methylase
MVSTAPIAGRGSPLGAGRDETSAGAAVRNMFAAVAPRYDFLNHFLSVGRDIAWRRATARALKDILANPGSRVADVCCGTGDLSFCLGRRSQGLVMGADFCHPMLAIARGKAGAKDRRIHFLEANTLHLPFADASLDAITSAFGFRNLADYRRGIDEMRRVLKRGGRLAILEFSRVRWPIFGPIFRFYFRRR